MPNEWPKIVSRQTTEISPWVRLIARQVEFSPGSVPEVYHSIGQSDYLSILAVTPDGRIPLVRQYRPAIEAFSLELPAGLVEAQEEPPTAAVRELLEETGFPAKTVHALGKSVACPGRLSNHIHSFFIETGEQSTEGPSEPGLTVQLVTPSELAELIRANEFVTQMHLGTILQARLRGLIRLPP